MKNIDFFVFYWIIPQRQSKQSMFFLLILILNDKSLTVIKTICSLETKTDIEKEIVYCIEGHSYLKQEVH